MSAHDDPLERLAREPGPGGARPEFHGALEALELRLIAGATEIAAAVRTVTEAFVAGDRQAAATCIARSHDLARACVALEDDGYLLLARQSPVARDLRRIVVVVRSAGDVQRSASLLRHVAESLAWVRPPDLPAPLRELVVELGGRTADLCDRAVDAWRETDGLAALDLDRDDDEVDHLQRRLIREVYAEGGAVEEAVTLALVGRYYERVADHAVELARGVAYVVTGDRLVDV